MNNESLRTCFKMLFLTKEKNRKFKKKSVFITELNVFFASLLGCQLKKHSLNPPRIMALHTIWNHELEEGGDPAFLIATNLVTIHCYFQGVDLTPKKE